MACFLCITPSATCIVEPKDDTWVVEWVAPRESDRGRGDRESQIALGIGDDSAQRVYTSVGVEVIDEAIHEAFEAAYWSPGARRMQRAL